MNLLGVLYGTRAFLPAMLRDGHGHVVNVASLAGRFAAPGTGVYSATKHAVVAFSESTNYDAEGRGRACHRGESRPRRRRRASRRTTCRRGLVMRAERVAEAIVKVVRDEIAPELAFPAG